MSNYGPWMDLAAKHMPTPPWVWMPQRPARGVFFVGPMSFFALTGGPRGRQARRLLRRARGHRTKAQRLEARRRARDICRGIS